MPRPTEQDGPGTSGATGMQTGTSPFDEPTDQFPVQPLPAAGTRPHDDPDPQSQWGGEATAGSLPEFDASGAADEHTRVIPRAPVVSQEDDLGDTAGMAGAEAATQRIPTYEELSSERRAPTGIAAERDAGRAGGAGGTERTPKAAGGRGTLDAGLLVVRVVLGAILLAHGLQKVTGNWGGPDLDGFRAALAEHGYDYAHALSIIGPVGEIVAGVALIVGLATPFAAAGAVALLINAWCFVQAGTPGSQFFTDQSGATGSGVELETMLLAAAVGIVLAGPGVVSLDSRRGWTRRPRYLPAACLAVGVAAGIVVWVLLNGANPFA